jgi:hypothetical protein
MWRAAEDQRSFKTPEANDPRTRDEPGCRALGLALGRACKEVESRELSIYPVFQYLERLGSLGVTQSLWCLPR